MNTAAPTAVWNCGVSFVVFIAGISCQILFQIAVIAGDREAGVGLKIIIKKTINK